MTIGTLTLIKWQKATNNYHKSGPYESSLLKLYKNIVRSLDMCIFKFVLLFNYVILICAFVKIWCHKWFQDKRTNGFWNHWRQTWCDMSWHAIFKYTWVCMRFQTYNRWEDYMWKITLFHTKSYWLLGIRNLISPFIFIIRKRA